MTQLHSNSTRPVKGLTTLAFLKAQYDQGSDYLDMFQPFVLEAIEKLGRNDFVSQDVKVVIEQSYGLTLPEPVVGTLLKRICSKGDLRREGGRYFLTNHVSKDVRIEAARDSALDNLNILGVRFVEFARMNGHVFASTEDALACVFSFMSDNQVRLLLEDEIELVAENPDFDLPRLRLVASFIQEVCVHDENLTSVLKDLLAGFVLQNALLLRDVATPSKSFSDLSLYLDSGFLFGLLGLKGEAQQVASLEFVSGFTKAGAKLRTFEQTVSEMKRILTVHEQRFSTAEGRATLRQTPMTRHLIETFKTPSDIRQLVLLIDSQLEERGIQIDPTPDRVPSTTWDEEALGELLKGRYETSNTPRILHDIDCVAAVLTLRRGTIRTEFEHARAIFASASSQVVQTVKEWYRTSGGKGVSPMVHIWTLSSVLWLKNPAVATTLKLRELVALCSAALKPSAKTWERFLAKLRGLVDDNRVSSDEAVAIVASGFTDNVLAEFESNERDIDAESVLEVVDRVRNEAIRDTVVRSETQVKAAEERAETAERQFQQRDFTLRKLASVVATSIAFTIATAVAVVVTVGSLLLLGDGWRSESGWFVAAAVAVSVAFSTLSMVFELSVLRFYRRFRDWIHGKVLDRLTADEEEDSSKKKDAGRAGF